MSREVWNKGKKEKIKHVYYTNGIKNIRIPFNEEPPEGFYRGRIVKWSEESKKKKAQSTYQTKLERYGDKNYNNMEKNRKTKLEKYGDENYNNSDKIKQTCLEKYDVDNVSKSQEVRDKISNKLKNHEVSEETKQKISISNKGKKLSEEALANKLQKTYETYRKNGLFKKRKTKPEKYIETLLINTFGENNVIYNYFDKNRYPYACDFYVKSLHLFIEVHAG